MIVTVTLNPAVHVRYETERMAPGRPNQVSRVSYQAGGRGLAVARVLHTFGHEVVAAGLVGGAAGETIRNELARAGVATQFTRIAMETRRVVEVADVSTGGVTTFSEPAPYITTEELGRLAADYRSLMADATVAVLSGSLPAGLPAETYGSLATYAAEAGVPVVLDAGGTALWHGARRRPALAIPEPPPGPGIAGGPPGADAAAWELALDPAGLVASGAGGVAILSDHVVRVITAQGEWRAWLPGERDLTRSRDALVAGFVPGITLGWSWPDMLRHALALAASAQPTDEVDLDIYEALMPMVGIDPAD